ncbi:hypothetical protein D3C78_806730 [compost metagenome]
MQLIQVLTYNQGRSAIMLAQQLLHNRQFFWIFGSQPELRAGTCTTILLLLVTVQRHSNLHAGYACDIRFGFSLLPLHFILLRSNQSIDILGTAILSYKRGRESESPGRLNISCHAKHRSR